MSRWILCLLCLLALYTLRGRRDGGAALVVSLLAAIDLARFFAAPRAVAKFWIWERLDVVLVQLWPVVLAAGCVAVVARSRWWWILALVGSGAAVLFAVLASRLPDSVYLWGLTAPRWALGPVALASAAARANGPPDPSPAGPRVVLLLAGSDFAGLFGAWLQGQPVRDWSLAQGLAIGTYLIAALMLVWSARAR